MAEELKGSPAPEDSGAPRGRPTKLTPELQEEICMLLRAGNYVETVCDYVGLNKQTFYNWLNWGERGWKRDREKGYSAFFDAVKRAVAHVEITTLHDVRRGVDNWQARAWWLERRHPQRWRQVQRSEVEHSGTLGIDLQNATDAELQAIIDS